jgi:hypothetical protein
MRHVWNLYWNLYTPLPDQEQAATGPAHKKWTGFREVLTCLLRSADFPACCVADFQIGKAALPACGLENP